MSVLRTCSLAITVSTRYVVICVCVAICTVTEVVVPEGKTPWIEVDDVRGLTDGDKELSIGDIVDKDQVIQIDECNEWLE